MTSSYFDAIMQSIQHQRWHGQCSDQSLQALHAVGFHGCLLRNDDQIETAVKLCALRNLRSTDERLSQEEADQFNGVHSSKVLQVGRTPVMTAVWVDALSSLHILRGAGASFTLTCSEDDDCTALHYAVMLNRFEMVRYMLPLLPRKQLLACTRTYGDTPLHMAARLGHYELVGVILEHVARLHKEDTFVWEQLQRANNSRPAEAHPPSSTLMCHLLLSRDSVDGFTVAALLAMCTTDTSDDVIPKLDDPGLSSSTTAETRTAGEALAAVLRSAEAHDCLVPLILQVRSVIGASLLTCCKSPSLWNLVSHYQDKLGVGIAWEMTSPQPISQVVDDDEDSRWSDLLALRAAASPTNATVPILTMDGETPLFALALDAKRYSSSGMVDVWLSALCKVAPAHIIGNDTPEAAAAIKLLHLRSIHPSAWSTVIQSHGASNAIGQRMIHAATAADVLSNQIRDSCGWGLLNAYDNERSSRRLLHHLAYQGDHMGIAFVRTQLVAPILQRVRSTLHALPIPTVPRPGSADTASVTTGTTSPLCPLAQVSPLVRPQSRGSQEDAASLGNASFSRLPVDSVNLELRESLQQAADLLGVVVSLFTSTLLSVDQDNFQPLFLAAGRDEADAVRLLCSISDDIWREAAVVGIRMVSYAACITTPKRAAATQAALQEASNTRGVRRSVSNVPVKRGSVSGSQMLERSPSIHQQGAPSASVSNTIDLDSSTTLAASAHSSGRGNPMRSSAVACDVKELLAPLIPPCAEVLLKMIFTQLDAAFVALDSQAPVCEPNDAVGMISRAANIELQEVELVLKNVGADDSPLATALRGCESAATAALLLNQTHLIRKETTALQLAVDGCAAKSVSAIVCEVVERWTQESDRVARHAAHVPTAPGLEASHLVVHKALVSCGNDVHEGRNVIHIAVYRGDVVTLYNILDALIPRMTSREATLVSCSPPHVCPSAWGAIVEAMCVGWSGGRRQYAETPSLWKEASRYCSLALMQPIQNTPLHPVWHANSVVESHVTEKVAALVGADAAVDCCSFTNCRCRAMKTAIIRWIAMGYGGCVH